MRAPERKLVFDIGVYKGEDTDFYLTRGFKVVAVDANQQLVRDAEVRFSRELASEQLILLNVAISDKDGDEVCFYLSDRTEWSSLKKIVSKRGNVCSHAIKMESRSLLSLIRQYGVPHYCKVDIEGADAITLKALMRITERPQFMSAETECVGESEKPNEEQVLETLNILEMLGYRQFKLVDQNTLSVLEPNLSFYGRWSPYWPVAIIKRSFALRRRRRFLRGRLGYSFALGSSGPFGDDLDTKWLSYEVARETILFHRRDYFSNPWTAKYGFWCDWHVKL